MALPDITIQRLLESGVHFGHQTHRWNPKMQSYIYGVRNNVHIFDLTQTVPLMHQALKQVSDTVAGGGRVLFVGTKRQASQIVADTAKQCAQYYVNHRWLGGMLTNWNTISNSIKRLRTLEETDAETLAGLTKKERLQRSREHEKLELALGGIKDMGGIPDLLFVIDTNKEAIAIQEAKRLGIPVAAIVDSNCDPSNVDLPIPGNDDATRAIALYCEMVSNAVIDGISRSQVGAGIDLGAAEETPEEPALKDTAAQASSEAEEPAKESKKKPAAKKDEAKADQPKKAAKSDDKKADDKKADDKKSDDKKSATKKAADKTSADKDKKTADKDKKSDDKKADTKKVASKDASDDLTKLKGIGPAAATKLNAAGVNSYADMAGLSDDDIARIGETVKVKAEWIEEAKSLV